MQIKFQISPFSSSISFTALSSSAFISSASLRIRSLSSAAFLYSPGNVISPTIIPLQIFIGRRSRSRGLGM